MRKLEDVNSDGSQGPHLAAYLALHLVAQVLDEACMIAKSLEESGRSRYYLSKLKKVNLSSKLEINCEDLSFAEQSENNIMNENNNEAVANIVATSTPEKYSGEHVSSVNPEVDYLGQGDGDEIDMPKCTSTFINHLFDMSEVETVSYDNLNETILVKSNNLTNESIIKIMDSCVEKALNMAYDEKDETVNSQSENVETNDEKSYTPLLATTFVTDRIELQCDDESKDDEVLETLEPSPKKIENEVEKSDSIKTDVCQETDVTTYEKTFLTLNRDYEYSEEDESPVIHDPKSITLQEVELLTANTSDENLTNRPEAALKPTELAATSADSAAASGSRKGSIVQKCRMKSVKFFACLRSWWNCRSHGKRKMRTLKIEPGLLTISPRVRSRRAASLLDHSRLKSPSPSRTLMWKFNTVNEAVVSSSRWKDYSLEMTPDKCGEQ